MKPIAAVPSTATRQPKQRAVPVPADPPRDVLCALGRPGLPVADVAHHVRVRPEPREEPSGGLGPRTQDEPLRLELAHVVTGTGGEAPGALRRSAGERAMKR